MADRWMPRLDFSLFGRKLIKFLRHPPGVVRLPTLQKHVFSCKLHVQFDIDKESQSPWERDRPMFAVDDLLKSNFHGHSILVVW